MKGFCAGVRTAARRWAGVPQGLKPCGGRGVYGTSKLVPFRFVAATGRLLSSSLVCGALVLMGVRSAVSQQAVVPPPNPADSSPTLAVTMKFLQDKLGGIGLVSFPPKDQEGSFVMKEELTEVVADPSVCTLRYTKPDLYGQGGVESNSVTVTVPLREVAQIRVTPVEVNYGPPVHLLFLDVPKYAVTTHQVIIESGKKHVRHESSGKANLVMIYLNDEDVGNRIAKAMQHAVELCVAAAPPAKKSDEPF